MRLDKYLKVSRLIKRRTVANEACDEECILVNGDRSSNVSGNTGIKKRAKQARFCLNDLRCGFRQKALSEWQVQFPYHR